MANATNQHKANLYKSYRSEDRATKNKKRRWEKMMKAWEKGCKKRGAPFNPKYTTFEAWHDASKKGGKAGLENARLLNRQAAAERKAKKSGGGSNRSDRDSGEA
jgi:hypothetical protein